MTSVRENWKGRTVWWSDLKFRCHLLLQGLSKKWWGGENSSTVIEFSKSQNIRHSFWKFERRQFILEKSETKHKTQKIISLSLQIWRRTGCALLLKISSFYSPRAAAKLSNDTNDTWPMEKRKMNKLTGTSTTFCNPFLFCFLWIKQKCILPTEKYRSKKLSKQKKVTKNILCLFMFIDLKIFASPGESGSTQETCLPTPSSKRWACVEAIGDDNV